MLWVWKSSQDFEITPAFVNRGLMAILYGDLFMRVLYRVRPYEKVKGAANTLYKKWKRCCMPKCEKRKMDRI